MLFRQKMENKNLIPESKDNCVSKSRKDLEWERELYEMLTEDISGWPNQYDLWLEKDLEDKEISEWEREMYEESEREFYGVSREDIIEEDLDSLDPWETDWFVFWPEDS